MRHFDNQEPLQSPVKKNEIKNKRISKKHFLMFLFFKSICKQQQQKKHFYNQQIYFHLNFY